MSDSDSSWIAPPKKRQKPSYDDSKVDYDINTVMLMYYGELVDEIPLLNFRTFAPEKMQYLETEIAESKEIRWKIFTYNCRSLHEERDVKRWACWLKYQDARLIAKGESEGDYGLHKAMHYASNDDYKDALLDAWMLWLQDMSPGGGLNIKRLRSDDYFNCNECEDNLGEPTTKLVSPIMLALILHHDGEAALSEDMDTVEYNFIVCERVRELAQRYFYQPDRKPKDPLQLSEDEFCKKYHSHHKKNLPCYKTRRLSNGA